MAVYSVSVPIFSVLTMIVSVRGKRHGLYVLVDLGSGIVRLGHHGILGGAL